MTANADYRNVAGLPPPVRKNAVDWPPSAGLPLLYALSMPPEHPPHVAWQWIPPCQSVVIFSPATPKHLYCNLLRVILSFASRLVNVHSPDRLILRYSANHNVRSAHTKLSGASLSPRQTATSAYFRRLPGRSCNPSEQIYKIIFISAHGPRTSFDNGSVRQVSLHLSDIPPAMDWPPSANLSHFFCADRKANELQREMTPP